MLLVIQRCIKPPGLIFAASTYRIVLNEEGLYLILLGRAMGPSVKTGGYNSGKLAGQMIQKIEAKMMAQLDKREKGIDNSKLNNELDSNKSRHFKSASDVQLKFKKYPNGMGKLQLKGLGVNLKLDIANRDVDIAQNIVDKFNN